MTYSRRTLYAMGEPFGESATQIKSGGYGRIYGGGNPIEEVFDAGSDLVEGAGDLVGDVVSGVGDAGQGILDSVNDIGVQIDQSVRDAVPGGWMSLVTMAASPYLGPAGMGALGAFGGSGLAQGKKFNLMGAITGGATAYGLASLGEGLNSAGGAGGEYPTATPYETSPDVNSLADLQTPPPQVNDYVNPNSPLNAGADAAGTPTLESTRSLAKSSLTDALKQGNFADAASQVGQDISSRASNVSEGIKNLAGIGETGTPSSAFDALTNNFGYKQAGALVGGIAGTDAMDQAKEQADQQLAQGKISQAEYDSTVAQIETNKQKAVAAVKQSPFEKILPYAPTNPTASRSTYAKNTAGNLYGGTTNKLYAEGGIASLPDGNTTETLMAGGITNDFHFVHGGMTGVPRFLSGGGDGMSDSIKASIDGNQEARLADGEFVIPADVVSHLGNGSSKAGAKQLYSMMDRVRKARTGNPKQGKQINPNKFTPV